MPTFEDREKGFEAKFKLDQEARFKVTARRNKMLGLWAAQKLGLTGEAAEGYAKEVVAADFDRPGDDDVIAKLVNDFKAKGVAGVDAAAIKKELDRLAAAARAQVSAEQRK